MSQNDDLISRQAAIEAMEDVDWYHIGKDGQLVHGANSKEDEPLYKAEDVYKVLEQLPSAQPEPCEDTISRQAVLDALQKHFNPTGAELSSDLASVLAGVGVVINTMPPSLSRPQWIPCNERLPEEYGNYLVSFQIDDEPDIGTYNPDTTKWSACDSNGFYWVTSKGLEVIAWMPLPEPYAERRTDEM